MTWVALSLGSNINPIPNLSACLDALLLKFNDLSLSSVFESEAIGFEGDNFFNMAVGFQTDMELGELITTLKKIEDDCGRDRSQPRFSGRSMDIDVLLYGNKKGLHDGVELPRPEITENAYVLWPLAQIAPNRLYPGRAENFRQLWDAYDKSLQRLWPVDFTWHGRRISQALNN